jgi:aspartate/methionine/tyrosine aminotransferase
MTTSRLRRMTSFIVMDVLEKAQELERRGIEVVHLEVGEPDFDTPACVRAAVCRALEDGHTHYTHSLGLPALREAICQDYQRRYGVRVRPENVIVFSGTSPAMMALFAALLEPGDETVISDPHYACYPNFIRFVDGVPVTVPIHEADGFQLRPEAIAAKITPRTKAIFINSPANPTGNLLSAERMATIAELGPHVISDEIYHGLVYEGQARSILEFTDRAFVLNGFSKRYAMTGLRLGYLIAPPAFVRPIQKIAQNFFISANAAVQYAGLAALTDPSAEAETDRMREVYNQRRLYMIQRLQAMGLGITVPPTGAFYVFANARHVGTDSLKLAFDILEKAHVGVTPGIDFGQGGEGYLRFSYANSMENIAEGMDRLERYLKLET